jgi:hypothetical protein
VKTLTFRDFRTRPRQVLKTIAYEGEALLTLKGRPVALMLGVEGDSLEESMETLRRARALQALHGIRRQSKERGLEKVNMRQIDALVAKSRKERRRRLDR